MRQEVIVQFGPGGRFELALPAGEVPLLPPAEN